MGGGFHHNQGTSDRLQVALLRITFKQIQAIHDRHMMGGNPLDLGGLADDVTALTRVLRSLYHHFTINHLGKRLCHSDHK